jgi:6-pyruvoyltetrahydropterin/6-carboxytetrahydropterin synthase
MAKRYLSTKLVDGFSIAFRQWKAQGSHCHKLHGYAIEFKLFFECKKLDDTNWVQDFGFLKQELEEGITVRQWFKRQFDHKTILAIDDPYIATFEELQEQGVLDLILMEGVGCEKFAQFVFDELREFIKTSSGGRVKLVEVKCIENKNNSASYSKRKVKV